MQSPSPRQSSPRHGFALLITITLLAFLVLLLVGLSSFSRVETQVSGNNQALARARENAMTAVNLALGQLQQYAGPDKVVSARADITGASLTQPYLTGLWKTTNTTSTPDTWLVSGNEASPTANTPASVPSPSSGTEPVDDAGGTVFLVGSNSVSASAQRVRLNKQAITASSGTVPGVAGSPVVGHYAWWVGDEGIKASASLINPLLGSNPIAYDNSAGSDGQGDNWGAVSPDPDATKRARLDQMQLTRPRLEHLFTGFNPDTDGLTALPDVKTRSQLLLMTNSPTADVLKGEFHSITPLSRAVLADVADGGLKKDLSDVTATPNPAILRYQQARATNPATGYTATYTPVPASVATASIWPAYSLGPVITELGIRFNFYLSSTDNTVHYSYIIDAALWNPYAAQLNLSASTPLTLVIGGLPAITVTTDKNTNVTFTPSVTATINPAATSTWAAGQIQIFRGGSDLEPVATPGAMADQTVPGATADAGATTVTAASAAVASGAFTVTLKVNNAILATYTPTLSFNAASVSNGTPPAPASTGWLMGYGYQFADDLATFTNGAATPAFDARLPVLTGAFADTATTADWQDDPADNTGGIGSAGTFGSANTIVLYDLPRQEVVSLGEFTHVIGDKPYMLGNPWGNTTNALFDQYHVSTVPRFATAWTAESGLPLPNRYVEVYHPDGTSTIALTELRSSTDSARYLLQKGAFNINSTSVDAWNAVLGSRLLAWKYSADLTTGSTLDNVFFRLPHGAQQLANPPLVTGGSGTAALSDANAPATGGRQLTATEVTSLATQIVAGIQAHGHPFVSLQEFINDGVIANAIASAGLNGALSANNQYAPGALTQADVISEMAPFITARSDTFVIRAYGDVQNPVTNAINGRVWCEAVVQRVPDLADNPSAPVADVVTANVSTYPFGRKFKIVSFRWLTPADL